MAAIVTTNTKRNSKHLIIDTFVAKQLNAKYSNAYSCKRYVGENFSNKYKQVTIQFQEKTNYQSFSSDH